MNKFINLIKDRRSIREYTDRHVDMKILEEIVDCGRLAPSAKNIQPWAFIVVTDKAKLKKIAEQVEWGDFIKDSSACIVVCGDKEVKRFKEDCCLATENMILAAKSLGIGSCYVAALGKDTGDVRELLNIPENLEIVCFLPLGYFEKNPKPHDKKDLKDLLHWQIF
ncbi:MAG: nitroreductase family protein [Candidatus Aenigmarchaeota archaeon]|nr:nitroreductase family protein [Candidatus Aenigmarchaeota archaeon]